MSKQYNHILNKSNKMPFHTDMGLVLKSFKGKENEYNWLISNFELNQYPEDIFNRDFIWISGDELSDKLDKNDIQFIWAVFSGFKKDIIINLNEVEEFPKPMFDEKSLSIQHPQAQVEIICFDSTFTLLKTKDEEVSKRFKEFFNEAEDL